MSATVEVEVRRLVAVLALTRELGRAGCEYLRRTIQSTKDGSGSDPAVVCGIGSSLYSEVVAAVEGITKVMKPDSIDWMKCNARDEVVAEIASQIADKTSKLWHNREETVWIGVQLLKDDQLKAIAEAVIECFGSEEGSLA